jgi:hypothetical protein
MNLANQTFSSKSIQFVRTEKQNKEEFNFIFDFVLIVYWINQQNIIIFLHEKIQNEEPIYGTTHGTDMQCPIYVNL